ncbi:hypothetical protein BDN70DRAFT_879583 [Pholiota conissans]|uniref:F-box domain-containing protein n=1 Tax=Pholiota conissans TaxID=109636 RepID=A0A9P5Z141_9AGAR|nr:hypothetical protein BDN70DRAFT_879583 [Pholiota conissans]
MSGLDITHRLGELAEMHGGRLLDDFITSEDARRRIYGAIEHHQSTISTLKAQIVDLEHSVHLHQTYVSTLKVKLNFFASVSHFPPEILCSIFSFAQEDDVGGILPYSAWTGFTHVCHHWRKVAIHSPTLWKELNFGNLKWLQEAAKRAQGAEVVIIIPGQILDYRNAVNFAVKPCLRIKGLRIIDNSDMELWGAVHDMLSQSPPQLNFLELEGVDATIYQYPHTVQQTATGITPIPSKQVRQASANLTQLRSLRLIECSIKWDLHLLFQPSLTHLSLRSIDPTPSGQELVLAMKAMSGLQHLDLDNAFHPADQFSLESWTTFGIQIHFAHLRVLRITSDNPSEVEAFFRLITFPPDAIVKMSCAVDQVSDAPHVSSIIEALGRSYSVMSRPATSGFQNFIMYQPEYNNPQVSGIMLSFSTGIISDEDLIYDDHEDAKLNLEFMWEPQPSNRLIMKDIINAIFTASIPLQDVQRVYFDVVPEQDEVDSELLLNTYGKLPELASVVTGMDTSKLFVGTLELALSVQALSTDAVKQEYFPALSSICFHNTTITDATLAPDPIAVPVEQLQDCLVRRYRRGAGIGVRFVKCNGLGGEATVDSLEENLNNVIQAAKMVSANSGIPASQEDIIQL